MQPRALEATQTVRLQLVAMLCRYDADRNFEHPYLPALRALLCVEVWIIDCMTARLCERMLIWLCVYDCPVCVCVCVWHSDGKDAREIYGPEL